MRRFWQCRQGATSIEYALIVGLIFLAIVGSVGTIGPPLVTFFTNVNSGLSQ